MEVDSDSFLLDSNSNIFCYEESRRKAALLFDLSRGLHVGIAHPLQPINCNEQNSQLSFYMPLASVVLPPLPLSFATYRCLRKHPLTLTSEPLVVRELQLPVIVELLYMAGVLVHPRIIIQTQLMDVLTETVRVTPGLSTESLSDPAIQTSLIRLTF